MNDRSRRPTHAQTSEPEKQMNSQPRLTQSILCLLTLTAFATGLRAQISPEEAERRLKEKLASRPAATQPAAATESDRLREENRRLRLQVMALQGEVATLKDALARAAKSSPATTRPAEDGAEKAIVGRWRGGDITAGSGYLLDFGPDGVYTQNWIAYSQRDGGQYRIADGALEMWSNKAPEDRKHNRYKMTLENARLTLVPQVIDGVEVKNARPLILQKAE